MGNSLFLETYRGGRKATGYALQQIVLLIGIKGFFFFPLSGLPESKVRYTKLRLSRVMTKNPDGRVSLFFNYSPSTGCY
jgi:hypothetical protein